MKGLIVGLALFVGACGVTPQGQAARLAIAQYGAQVSDGELTNSIWLLCNAATVGAVTRRFKGADMNEYNDFCAVQRGSLKGEPNAIP